MTVDPLRGCCTRLVLEHRKEKCPKRIFVALSRAVLGVVVVGGAGVAFTLGGKGVKSLLSIFSRLK